MINVAEKHLDDNFIKLYLWHINIQSGDVFLQLILAAQQVFLAFECNLIMCFSKHFIEIKCFEKIILEKYFCAIN
ncbi:MAG: hypothetical protein KME22_20115 [Hassallia sp. WJT32-NPBG1]|nr:hypothetical protein [Hassallia sp. WJT32-NPBG1]